MPNARTKLLCTNFIVGALAAGIAPFAPSLLATPAFAQQRVEIRQEFRVALEPHGQFRRHERFGEVWKPARVARDWRPYTVGRWVYTDDWGWYWNADQSEADWGWVAFHYGRWIDDREMGWVWVPGNEWGPAWVNWRRGEGPAVAARGSRNASDVRYIGWSPLPPDDVVVEYRDNPDVWIFVRAGDIVAPRINTVIIRERRPEILQRTVIVNRTVVVRDRGVIVNPGIAPSYVAAFAGRPVVSYEVRPRVIAGTSRINNAIEVRIDDLRDRKRFQQARPQIRETKTRIEAVREVPAPRALEANEQGRLGERPPRAAQGAAEQRRDGLSRDGRDPRQQSPALPGEKPALSTQDQRLAPGRERTTPGQAETVPGRQDRTITDRAAPDRASPDRVSPDRGTSAGRPEPAPGRSGAAPGRNEATPGQAETAPGRSGATPGQSGAKPPGQAGTAPGRNDATPGLSGAAPGRSADTPTRAQPDRAQPREERGQAQQQRQEKQERAAEPRGNRGETTGATPNRGGDTERGAQPRAPQKPDPAERKRENP